MSRTDIDKYLFNEMSEIEREKFEDEFASDDQLFYEIAERENELVDRYVGGKLAGDEKARFERTLESLPARRQKVENSRTLREMIVEGRTENKTITIAERSSWFSRLFSFGPAMQFASVGLILVLVLTSLFFWSGTRSLEQELAASRQREAELVTDADNDRASTSDLTADLDAERQRIQALEAEIAKLRNVEANTQTNSTRPPVIATLMLPVLGIRGGGVPVRNIEIPKKVDRLSIVIGIPSDVASERVTIQLNGQPTASNRRVITRGGEKSVGVNFVLSKWLEGRNELTVTDSSGVVASYIINLSRSE